MNTTVISMLTRAVTSCLLMALTVASHAWAALPAPTSLATNQVALGKYQISYAPSTGSTSSIVTLTKGSMTYTIRTTSTQLVASINSPGTWTVSVRGRTMTDLSPAATTSLSVTIPAPTTAPTGLTLEPQAGGVDLRWTAGSGTDRMLVSWTDPATSQLRQVSTTIPYMAIRNLINNTSYTFTLAWQNTGGVGPSSTITGAPLADRLTSLTAPVATATSNTSAQLTWPSVTGSTFYAVYAGPSSDATTLMTTTRARIALTNALTVTGIADNWYAVVLAGNANGLSRSVNTPLFLPTVLPPTVAPPLLATPGIGSVMLTWGVVPTASSYQVYTSLGTFDQGTAALSTGATSPSILTGLTPATTYASAIRGVNAGGSGPLSTPVSYTPYSAQDARSMHYLAGGYGHLMAMRPGGILNSLGLNDFGQLGDNTIIERHSPVQVANISQMVATAAGFKFTMGLKNDGTVWTWGHNNMGQLGDGTNTGTKLVPYQVPGLTNVVDIAAGYEHAVILKSDGTVWAWGRNDYHQVSSGAEAYLPSPVQVPGLTGIVSIAAGQLHGMALKNDGTVFGWGVNLQGELGDGTTTPYTGVVQASITGVKAIAAGALHSMALKTNGTLYAWGWNSSGQLGNNSQTDSATPIQVSGLTNIVEASAGAEHSMALDNTGQIWTWGNNTKGQIGNGNTTVRLTPYAAYKNTAVATLLRGPVSYQSAAMLSDWRVVSWGFNFYGQSANGTSGAAADLKVAALSSLYDASSSLIMTSSGGQTILSWTPTPGATSYDLSYMPSPYVSGSGVSIPNASSPFVVPNNPAGTPYSYQLTPVGASGSGSTMLENPPSRFNITTTETGTFMVPSGSFNSQYAKLEGNPAFVPGGMGVNPACNDNSGNVYDWSIGPYPNANVTVLFFQGPPITGAIRQGSGPTIGSVVYGYYVCHILGQPGTIVRVND